MVCVLVLVLGTSAITLSNRGR